MFSKNSASSRLYTSRERFILLLLKHQYIFIYMYFLVTYFDVVQSIDLQQILLSKTEYRYSEKRYYFQWIVTEHEIPEIQQLFRWQVTAKASHQPFEYHLDTGVDKINVVSIVAFRPTGNQPVDRYAKLTLVPTFERLILSPY